MVEGDDIREHGRGGGRLRVAIVTVGCRANQADSAWLGRSLDPRRIEVVEPGADVDVWVVNSCAVTARAERDVRRAVHRARRLGGSRARVLLTGCMISARPGALTDLGELWQVVPSAERGEIPSMLAALVGEPASREGELHAVPRPLRRARPSLRVQDGCRMKCAYCSVPAGRGVQKSLEPRAVVERVSWLVEEGAQEVVICGINLGSWGRDLSPRRSLADLIDLLERETDVARYRFSSIEPWAIDDRVVQRLAEARRWAPHLHLPLQSGDDDVLARMRRPYRVERFARIVESLRAARPEIAIGTDVIAGFPGEGRAAHRNTRAVLERLAPSYVHVFGFSPRPGTAAESSDEQVEPAEIKSRVAELVELGRRLHARFVQALAGQELRVLVERRSPGDGRLRGTSGRFVTVRFDGSDDLISQLVPVVARTASGDEPDVVDGRLRSSPGRQAPDRALVD